MVTTTENINLKGNKPRVAVGLSGGVDSSVTALLLKQQGYDVLGVHIKCWDSRADGCRSDEDRASAVDVCAKLGIKFEPLEFIEEYKNRVINNFYKEYEAGRTPNPDILCNKEIKFGLFLEWAEKNGFDYVATGHYARVSMENGLYNLLKGIDSSKDQSYFLYLLNQRQLSKTLFPIGDLKKPNVRKMAQTAGLATYNRPDSMGICFIGDVDIKDFLAKRIKEKIGNVIDKEGNVIGKHQGVWFYTIGQRHGFEVTKYVGLPLYVTGKNVEKNELIVGFAKDVTKSAFITKDVHWININPFDSGSDTFVCDVRVRHLGKLYSSKLHKLQDNEFEITVEDNTIFGIAPGQSAVFYQGEVVLGGGIIS